LLPLDSFFLEAEAEQAYLDFLTEEAEAGVSKLLGLKALNCHLLELFH
jgi:hypothetical protein